MGMISKIYGSSEYMREVYTKTPKEQRRAMNAPVLTWSRERVRFEVYRAYDVRTKLKAWGFSFDPVLKCWYTAANRKAVRALKYANPEARQMITYFMTN